MSGLIWVMQLQGYALKRASKVLADLRNEFLHDQDRFRIKYTRAIASYHYRNNPFYKNLLNGRMPEEWNELPVITKGHFQVPIRSLLSVPYLGKSNYISNTSGSSGHPFFFAKDKFCHSLAWSNISYLYKSAGIDLGSKEARFFGIPLNRKGFVKEKIKDAIANRVRFPVFDLSDPVLERWIGVFRKQKFEYLNGYTSSLVYFARFCMRAQIVLKEVCPTLKTCIVTSEVCTPEDRSILQRGFGIPVVNEYGASELSIIAFENGKGQWPVSEELIYLEILDHQNKPVANGESGRVVCTSLHNLAFPLVRYEIGDVGVIRTIEGRRNITQLLGRVNDMAELPSGKISPGLTFYYISKAILENTGVINEFIIKQTHPDTFRFVIDAHRDLTKQESDLIRQKMDLYLEPNLNLEIERVEFIERPPSGKIKHFYNEIHRSE